MPDCDIGYHIRVEVRPLFAKSEVDCSPARWGDPGCQTALPGNEESTIKFMQKPDRILYLLRTSGIPVTTKAAPEPGTRIYRVHLFENHVLMVEKSYVQQQWTKYSIAHSDFQRIDPAVDDYEARAVIRLAIRSLYAVGLHLGQIILQAASPFRVKVRSISAEWDAEHKPGFLAEAEAWWLKEQGSWESPQIQLGADPEFALRHPDGKMALASDFMGISGVVGCDSTRYREDLALHQHPLVELRPAPSAEPDALFSRIVKALGAAAKKIVDKEVEWISGGMPFDGYPTGGHIHFSGIRPHFSLLRRLDAYLALPLVLIEDEGCQKRRPRYGFLGDVREKEYGIVKGFEYRTLPSWLVHPVVARGVLHLARLVASSADILSRGCVAPALIRAYYKGEKEQLVPYVNSIWKEISALPGYERSRSCLDDYFSFLLAGHTWPANSDLRKVWCHYVGKA